LAIADCLVSLIVLPLSIIKDFQGKTKQDINCVKSHKSNRSDWISKAIRKSHLRLSLCSYLNNRFCIDDKSIENFSCL
jgi:hypothetical protein